MNLNGKVGLITGATSGIGRAAAFTLAGRGMHVVVHGRNEQAAEQLRDELRTAGRKCDVLLGDIADPAVAEECVALARRRFGGLDLLIHSAGGPAPGGLLETRSEDWYRAFDVHVHAVFHLCRAAVPVMKERGGGGILLISSAAGSRGCMGALAYGAAKGALPQLARGLARELAEYNIRVNCVAPGIIRTPFQNGLSAEQARNNVQNRIPLRREGRPEDVAELMAALLENDFITGENVAIDGGMTMRIA